MSSLDQSHRNLKYSTIDGFCSTPWSLLSLPGSFLMAGLLNKYFEVGPFWFGIIASMPALANASNVLLIPVLARVLTVRELTLNFSSINAGLWLCALITIGFLPTGQPETVGLFFAIFYAFATLSQSLLVVGWTTWIGDIVPESIRGRYTGQRNRFISVSTLGFMLLSVCVLEFVGVSRGTYLALAGLAIFARFVAIFVQHLIQSKDPSGGSITSANWREDFARLTKERAYLRFVFFGSVCGFFQAFVGVICPLFAFNQLEVSATKFTLLSIVTTISGAFFVRIWGELIDRHGSVPVLILSFALWRSVDMVWIVLTPETQNWLFLIWLMGGINSTGFLLASFNLLLKLIPRSCRAAGISVNLTVTSLVAFIAPILAGGIIGWAESSGYNVDLSYRICFFVGLAGGLASLVILIGMKEPAIPATLNTIPGAMRTLRQQAVNTGLALFSNASFILRRKD